MTSTSGPSSPPAELQRSLGPWRLWALGVGYVISGMYFGWNLGLAEGGPYGMLVATALVTIMYVTFVTGYAELACAMPRAGGAFVYATKAFGPTGGMLAGIAQWVEFVFAPPAIAAAIGAYFTLFFPAWSPTVVALVAYGVFTAMNIYGVKHSATFELVVTVAAVVELLVFAGVTAPNFTWTAFSFNALPKGWWGVLPAIPYAIWFYLAIEGVANVAEEAVDPARSLRWGFGSSMATLVVLALLTFFSAVGVAGWEAVVYPVGTNVPSDSPLPLALERIVGKSHVYYHALIGIGLFGLLASFHGIILAAGRATFEFGRLGYAPKILGTTMRKRHTPAAALLANLFVGVAALLTGKTADIIVLAVFGALTLYLVSTVALMRLRTTHPDMVRPFRAPGYPWVPAVACALSLLCLVALGYTSPRMGGLYLLLVAAGYGWFLTVVPPEVREGTHS